MDDKQVLKEIANEIGEFWEMYYSTDDETERKDFAFCCINRIDTISRLVQIYDDRNRTQCDRNCECEKSDD